MSNYSNYPYGNPYGQPNYNAYPNYANQGNGYANMQSNYMNNNMYNQGQVQKPTFLPLTYTNGIEGAKAYIVPPNSTIYIIDSDNPILYQKSADYQGKYTLNAYKLEPISIENIGKNDVNKETSSTNIEYATKQDIQALQDLFNEGMNKLFNEIENAYRKPKNIQNQQMNNNINQEKVNK